MLTTHRFQRSAGLASSRGFTLVELLVVIGIIAILAGVALGPITAGLRKAQQSGGVQQARSLALAEFQYASDNNNTYPYGTSVGALAGPLVPQYISDTSMLVVSGSGHQKYSGNTPTSGLIFNTGANATTTATCDYDFVVSNGGTPPAPGALGAGTPDICPVVFTSMKGSQTFAVNTAATAAAIDSTCPLGVYGVAVCYKNNSAQFRKADASGNVTLYDGLFDASYAAKSLGQ